MKNALPKDVYHLYTKGDKITDNELTESIPFWCELSNNLSKCGPVFHLCANEANRVYIGLRAFAQARGLNVEQSEDSRFDITWKNTLNWEHLPNNLYYNSIDRFAKLAADTGYPHFAWSGRIYFTKTGAFTGIFSEDI